jgi:outer membrane protein OmpA-like peptidoglycan-associated protein
MMKALLTLLIGLLALCALACLCAAHHRARFERDLGSRAGQVLRSLGLAEAIAEAEGQIITLRGVVPGEDALRKAEAQLAALFGVAEVRNRLLIRLSPPSSPLADERRAAEGCQAAFSRLLREPIRYEPGSAALTPGSHPLLDKLAAAAATCPAAKIEIAGHTDPRGTPEENLRLSQERAEVVVKYLVARGVARERLSAVGYGPTRPIADNTTPEGMQKNRRIEFIVKGLRP